MGLACEEGHWRGQELPWARTHCRQSSGAAHVSSIVQLHQEEKRLVLLRSSLERRSTGPARHLEEAAGHRWGCHVRPSFAQAVVDARVALFVICLLLCLHCNSRVVLFIRT